VLASSLPFEAEFREHLLLTASYTAIRLPLSANSAADGAIWRANQLRGLPRNLPFRPVRRRQRPLRALDLTHVGRTHLRKQVTGLLKC